jgi:hypothetical protein
MGHNHIILNRDIVGNINVSENAHLSTGHLIIPVQKMIVDDIEAIKR